MLHVRTRKWPRALDEEKKRKVWPKAKKSKEKKRKKRKEAKGLSKKKREREKRVQSAQVCQRHKSEKKNERSTKCLKKRVICSMFDWTKFIVLHLYVVVTCLQNWSLTIFHDSPFILAFHLIPKSP